MPAFPRIRIKICGITNNEDARLAAELGADALGFICYPRSPRYIEPQAARAIIDLLPPFVTPVAVVVNESPEALAEIMAVSGCRVAQLHGDESPDYLAQFPFPVIKAVSVANAADIEPLSAFTHASAFLLDTRVPGQRGGTGATFDWTLMHLARRFARPLILAGGLSPENITEAIRIAQPDAVDLSSSLEAEPGKKDPAKVRRFFEVMQAQVLLNGKHRR